ncbi:hypothetical protein [Hyphomonas sp. BRH_c22]|uniref:hypothetical protein n=1 Tax=Hyphomonas sp. BRH_c22 TaxID=1629710 RepID=UPI0026364D79|nr:hypothetical protein [Hyphomonas sp. BRH_c22]
MADIDATLVQEVFNIVPRQRESDIHDHAKLDDFGRVFKVARWVLGHFQRLNARISHLNVGSADNTLAVIRTVSQKQATVGCLSLHQQRSYRFYCGAALLHQASVKT